MQVAPPHSNTGAGAASGHVTPINPATGQPYPPVRYAQEQDDIAAAYAAGAAADAPNPADEPVTVPSVVTAAAPAFDWTHALMLGLGGLTLLLVWKHLKKKK